MREWFLQPVTIPFGVVVFEGLLFFALVVLLLVSMAKMIRSTKDWKAFLRDLDERSQGRIPGWCFPHDREARLKLDEVFQAVRRK